jgi:hypothetical protein
MTAGMPEGELRTQLTPKTILLKTVKVYLILDRGDIVCPEDSRRHKEGKI